MAKPHVFLGRAEQFRIMMGHVANEWGEQALTKREVFERSFHHAAVENYQQAADWALTKCDAEDWSDSSIPQVVTDFLLDLLSDIRETVSRRVKPDSISGFKLSKVAEEEKSKKQ